MCLIYKGGKKMYAGSKNEVLENLIQQYGNSVLRMCYLYLKDYHLAEDVTQETFIQVYEKYGTFENRASIKTWIMQIAINRCKNQMRTQWFKRESLNVIPEIAVNDFYDEIFKKGTLLSEIMKLPIKYREVILLYYYQELSVKEISIVLNVKTTTIMQRLKRAREQLKPHLEVYNE